jgi:hypothetical protein
VVVQPGQDWDGDNAHLAEHREHVLSELTSSERNTELIWSWVT